jgi:hypothetical protein
MAWKWERMSCPCCSLAAWAASPSPSSAAETSCAGTGYKERSLITAPQCPRGAATRLLRPAPPLPRPCSEGSAGSPILTPATDLAIRSEQKGMTGSCMRRGVPGTKKRRISRVPSGVIRRKRGRAGAPNIQGLIPNTQTTPSD